MCVRIGGNAHYTVPQTVYDSAALQCAGRAPAPHESAAALLIVRAADGRASERMMMTTTTKSTRRLHEDCVRLL